MVRYSREQPLCFCEYMDQEGSRNHMCLCCCNCDAADKAFDSLCKNNGEFNKHCTSLCGTLNDRCRIPWPVGGALHIPVDLLISALGPPVCLYIASLSYQSSITMIFISPVILYVSNIISRLIHSPHVNHSVEIGQSTASKVFFTWMLSSLITTFCLFELAQSYREIDLWENMIVITMSAIIIKLLYKCKFAEKGRLSKSYKNVAGEFCEKCRTAKSYDTGHCSLCNVCIEGRDHHCVWINDCIGDHNHFYFVLLLCCVIANGVYGGLLLLQTLCTPAYLWDTRLLVPVDCRFLYDDQITALLFCGVCYTIFVVAFTLVLLGQQIFLISIGVSQLQWYRSVVQLQGEELPRIPTPTCSPTQHPCKGRQRSRWRAWLRVPGSRPGDLGVLSNWARFCLGKKAVKTTINYV